MTTGLRAAHAAGHPRAEPSARFAIMHMSKLWTYRESNPDLFHAMEPFYRYTIGPQGMLDILNGSLPRVNRSAYIPKGFPAIKLLIQLLDSFIYPFYIIDRDIESHIIHLS